MLTLLLVAAAFSLLVWGALTLLVVRALRRMPRLERLDPSPPARWPSVSLIVPARDEATHLEAALRSKLALDYPALQVVLVDDRSTDGTGAIADRLAEQEPRLTVKHLAELPDGWLGKVHALHRGVEAATGEWLLFTDADIHYAPDTLRRAVAYCEARGLDFLVGLPHFLPVATVVDACLVGFGRFIFAAAQADWLEDPKSTTSLGGGIFALARREAFAKTPGFERLRMEVGDDVALGTMMKRHGARCGVVLARQHLHLEMYPDMRAVVRGVGKASPAMGRFRLLPLVLVSLFLLALDLAPWAAMGVGAFTGAPLLVTLGAAGAVFQVSSAMLVGVAFGLGAWRGLLAPLGDPLMHALVLVTGLAAHWRGGITWRDTTYSLEALRAGSHFRYPWEK